MVRTSIEGAAKSGPSQSARNAQTTFEDSPLTHIALCVSQASTVLNPSGGTNVAGGNWTTEQIKNQLDLCDGGTGVWSAAKAANGGRDPIITANNTQFGGVVDLEGGNIVLDSRLDACTVTQIQIQELTNLSHKQDFLRVSSGAANGELGRESYIKAIERYEYDGVQNVIKAFDKCKDTWRCKTCEKEWARKYKTFEEYYSKALSREHKEHYGQYWDTKYKSSYEARHLKPPPDTKAWWQFW